ncbi:Piso0_005127 [Millerozyma farinosa CBS 7064]|uniref:Piso0_005127 protein n=1 Tax=Pichia sorbitophila (strain ATCC MYA-4447 / BCRC 22081 / CBS 7064 / NBRC 10061 / NRRL Y-12695) TaxID=559304 RepID=G8Y1C4_PICSO|nr:Piso0_005127 [Millerozyma farinosa CBS 7064]
MSSTVSYAKIAARGQDQDKKEVLTESEVNGAVEKQSIPSDQTTPDAAKEDAAANGSLKKDSAKSAGEEGSQHSTEPKKEKKSLAPAPVPEKSVWKSSSTVGETPVDEHKWPTPDKAFVEQQSTNTQKPQKFIKPITNKWVPINAKVILPSPRNNTQKHNKNKKNKKNSNQKKQGVNQPQNHSQAGQSTTQQGDQAQQNSSPVKKSDQEHMNNNQNFQDGARNKFGGQHHQKGGNRRFNNPNGNYKQKPATGHPQSMHQAPQLNGFYHPQPFVPNQNFENFNNRHFKPNQYRHQNNRNFRPNGSSGFIHGSMVMPPQFAPQPMQQIPPPISPKQDPQQALTQQVDYYFSLENLIKDIFLRKNMDEQGWVPLNLILNFKRVKIILNGIQNSIENKESNTSNQIILDSIKQCENLEIKLINDKTFDDAVVDDIVLRVKDNYAQWLLPNEN